MTYHQHDTLGRCLGMKIQTLFKHNISAGVFHSLVQYYSIFNKLYIVVTFLSPINSTEQKISGGNTQKFYENVLRDFLPDMNAILWFTSSFSHLGLLYRFLESWLSTDISNRLLWQIYMLEKKRKKEALVNITW